MSVVFLNVLAPEDHRIIESRCHIVKKIEKFQPTNCDRHHPSVSYDYKIDGQFYVMYEDRDEQTVGHLEVITSAVET